MREPVEPVVRRRDQESVAPPRTAGRSWEAGLALWDVCRVLVPRNLQGTIQPSRLRSNVARQLGWSRSGWGAQVADEEEVRRERKALTAFLSFLITLTAGTPSVFVFFSSPGSSSSEALQVGLGLGVGVDQGRQGWPM